MQRGLDHVLDVVAAEPLELGLEPRLAREEPLERRRARVAQLRVHALELGQHLRAAGDAGVDEQGQAVVVRDGAITSSAPELVLGEGSELRLQVEFR